MLNIFAHFGTFSVIFHPLWPNNGQKFSTSRVPQCPNNIAPKFGHMKISWSCPGLSQFWFQVPILSTFLKKIKPKHLFFAGDFVSPHFWQHTTLHGCEPRRHSHTIFQEHYPGFNLVQVVRHNSLVIKSYEHFKIKVDENVQNPHLKCKSVRKVCERRAKGARKGGPFAHLSRSRGTPFAKGRPFAKPFAPPFAPVSM